MSSTNAGGKAEHLDDVRAEVQQLQQLSGRIAREVSDARVRELLGDDGRDLEGYTLELAGRVSWLTEQIDALPR